MHELDLPRRYRTIFVCGAFGLGSDRERDREALDRFFEHLEPGGTLVLDNEVPWANGGSGDTGVRRRASLPEAWRRRATRTRRGRRRVRAATRILELDPLEQRVTLEIRA